MEGRQGLILLGSTWHAIHARGALHQAEEDTKSACIAVRGARLPSPLSTSLLAHVFKPIVDLIQTSGLQIDMGPATYVTMVIMMIIVICA